MSDIGPSSPPCYICGKGGLTVPFLHPIGRGQVWCHFHCQPFGWQRVELPPLPPATHEGPGCRFCGDRVRNSLGIQDCTKCFWTCVRNQGVWP